MITPHLYRRILFVGVTLMVAPGSSRAAIPGASLHETTIQSLSRRLSSAEASERASAAENLGFLRAYEAAAALAEAVRDPEVAVRREACLSLGWCGGRGQVPVLLKVLSDRDWSVRQSAWVALTNLTGMEFPFDAQADWKVHAQQARVWRDWWGSVPAGQYPAALQELLADLQQDLAHHAPVKVSSTYKGPASVLTDSAQTGFWQTKNVSFPQHCTVDLGREQVVGAVAITQYGKGYCMSDYALSVSSDGIAFRELIRKQELTPPELLVSFTPVRTRYIRVSSHQSERPLYPSTFYQFRAFEKAPAVERELSIYLGRERVLRALGSLGGEGAAARVLDVMNTSLSRPVRTREEKLMIQAGIRSLGRLGGDEACAYLIQLLDNVSWARYAADALGDCRGEASALALIEAYPAYALLVDGTQPAKTPPDDRPGFEAVDRMYETPHAIAHALSRFTFDAPELQEKLRCIAPLLVANMASDFDGAMLYEPQAFQAVNAYLLECAGVRREICGLALEALESSPVPDTAPLLSVESRARLLALARQGPGGTSRAAVWLTALCRDADFVPRLVALLTHENGWVRINAAKTLMFMNAKAGLEPIARLLTASKPEAEYGTFGGFLFKNAKKQGQDEYNAPSPCWREAYTRALGQLGGEAQVPLLTSLLNDERNVLEVRYAAAVALDEIGTPRALGTLVVAASAHPFHSIQLLAREALWKRGMKWEGPGRDLGEQAIPQQPAAASEPEALVFIKGSNDMPNDFQIDLWRQAYSTTDSGPTYRLGKNLYLLKPATREGKVSPLTRFNEGYVADCEVSWDGTHVVFARRGGEDPWWHIYELELKGGALKQLTRGPYHDVQPTYLPDGRIVFSSSRIGLRDEYHGYPATGLTVMNRDGSDVHCIGFNAGRDNEPAILPDGRIVFSRLDLFYSRLKTELTLQSTHPDGSLNQTLYGPERREFWRKVTQQSGERGWGEVPPRHRVLRLTQPQPLGREQVMVATTGGACVVGPGRLKEQLIPRDGNRAVTSLFPLDKDRALCAATLRTPNRKAVDLGIYWMDIPSGTLEEIYNDPATADFEARPVMARPVPHILPNSVSSKAYTARLLCNSTRASQEAITRKRGKLLRIIEGQPVTGRHHTHTNSAGEAWKNHTGTRARVLGTVPLAADGSFYVEIPADRLLHCQVLDSDRQVVGNQLIWMYARPGETRSCVGCHELPDSAAFARQLNFPLSARSAPLPCLPTGGEFTYRAKAWQKGRLDPETEARTRTVNAISLPGRR